MSTIYVFEAEVSALTAGQLAAGDKFLIHDASAADKRVALASDLLAYVGAGPLSGATFVGGAVYSANASFSFLVGTTLSAKIGFFGKAGTSQIASANQQTITATPVAITAAGFGYSTSAKMENTLNFQNAVYAALTDLGLWKGSV
jgi:hypothetical protein